MFLKYLAKSFAIFCLLLLAGCLTGGSMFSPAGDKPFKIESSPSGAAVYVMGENIGVTPLEISHKDVFPNIYPREKESLYGKIILKKAGCKDYTRTISGDISSYGLHAKLECADLNPAPSAAPAPSETVEQRLDKIKDLLNKGLITEEEAKKARERILKEL
jgi:hypothetical protein